MEEYANNIEEWFRDYLFWKNNQDNEFPLIDDYIKDIIDDNNFEERDSEEISEFYNIFCDMASFSSRMRIKVGDILAKKVIDDMLEEENGEKYV
jgi:hypothetical protein